MPLHHDPDHHKRRVALWVAVGCTMAAIVAIWLVMLPTQFVGFGESGPFGDAKLRTSGEAARQSFQDSLQALDNAWRNAMAKQAAAAEDQKTNKAVNDLKSKIEDAAAKPAAPTQP